MGENFFFVFSLLPAAGAMIEAQIKAGTLQLDSTTPWQIGLGVIFYSGVLFLLLSMLGVREKLMEAISPSMRNGIAVGIGLFIAFIGLQFTHLVIPDPGTCVKMNVAICLARHYCLFLRIDRYGRFARPACARIDSLGHYRRRIAGRGLEARPAVFGRCSDAIQTGRRIDADEKIHFAGDAKLFRCCEPGIRAAEHQTRHFSKWILSALHHGQCCRSFWSFCSWCCSTRWGH